MMSGKLLCNWYTVNMEENSKASSLRPMYTWHMVPRYMIVPLLNRETEKRLLCKKDAKFIQEDAAFEVTGGRPQLQIFSTEK